MGRKWFNIKDKKAGKDQANAKVYAKFGIEIYVAAKSGDPDPHNNQKLQFVIDRAKTYNVPRHVIDKAIEKAKGTGDETYTELRYEGFGPNGAMIIVDTLTNNANRTAANVRAAFSKNSGNMGVTGAVSYLFDKSAVLAVANQDADTLLESLMEKDIDVNDVINEGDEAIIYADTSEFANVRDALAEMGLTELSLAEPIEFIPQNEVTLEGDDLKHFEALYDALDDQEDVQKIYHNVENA